MDNDLGKEVNVLKVQHTLHITTYLHIQTTSHTLSLWPRLDSSVGASTALKTLDPLACFL